MMHCFRHICVIFDWRGRRRGGGNHHPRATTHGGYTMMTVTFLWILLFHLAAGDLTIISPEGEVTVSVGQRLVITCVSSEGHSIKWSCRGMVLSTEDAISTHTDASGTTVSTLTLHQVSEVNAGRCQCSNPDNYFDRDELLIKIQTSEPPRTVRIVEPDSDELRTVKDGKFTLKCEAEDGASIRWLHNDMPLHDMGSRVIITTSLDVEDQKLKSLLTRLSVSSQEAGRYSCQDENNPLSTDDVRVVVSETREDTIPVQMTQPASSSLTVDVDSHFDLQCRGDARASLTWYINNTLISLLNDPPQVTMAEDESSAKITVLTRTQARYEHSGVYSCRNGLDSDDKDAVTVYVRHPDDVPDVEYSTPTEIRREILKVGSSMSLQCSMATNANFETKWYKDEKRLLSGGKYLIREMGAAELSIQDTERQDAGVYKCTFLDKDTGSVIGNVIFNLTTVQCNPLTPPQNGSFVHCPQEPLYGDICTFTCQSGYRLTDMRPVQCDLEDGKGAYTWNMASPKCIGITSADVSDVIPTSMSNVLLRVGGRLTLQCKSGSSWTKGSAMLITGDKYTIEQHALIIKHTAKSDTGIYDCNIIRDDNGKLEGIKKFNVTSLSCPKLPALGNGSIDSCSNEPMYGETCYFKCDRGYKLHGSRSQTCELAHAQSKAYWTGTAKPVCVRDTKYKFSGHTSSACHPQSQLVFVSLVSLTTVVLLSVRQ